jgi:hypothetical protein
MYIRLFVFVLHFKLVKVAFLLYPVLLQFEATALIITMVVYLHNTDRNLLLNSVAVPVLLAVCLPINYVVGFFGIPFISQLCSSATMSNKNDFNTFMRLGGTLSAIGTGIAGFFKLYGWKLAAILSSNGTPCDITTAAITTAFAKANITIATTITIFGTDGPTQIAQYLSLARTLARGTCY